MAEINIANNALFYDINERKSNKKLISKLDDFASKQSSPVYFIHKPLASNANTTYDYEEAGILLIPGYMLLFIDFANNPEEFQRYREDFLEDLGYLSSRYEYRQILGRPRDWQDLIRYDIIKASEELDIFSFIEKYKAPKSAHRKIELLISLLIGSINSIERVGSNEPTSALESVKQRIILFDGRQSRFIYEDIEKKCVTIQGLAGTGKTELLLHKLRQIYISDKEGKIAFTCHNKVLSQDMRQRIPSFFNFMKVEEQIEWNSRLWVFPSWGSRLNRHSGIYSYICNFYDLNFRTFGETRSFDQACRMACKELDDLFNISPCFSYVFIDESQDFTQSFIDLCCKVTEKKVYVAGDIFQDIFDMSISDVVNCDYLLNKCYRTDPRTLMFAHSVGMGLYERPVLRWLEDKGWEYCGYQISRSNKKVSLSRVPIRRFDEEDGFAQDSIKVISIEPDKTTEQVIKCIDEISNNYSDVTQDDIAVIFISNAKTIYDIIDSLIFDIWQKYKWNCTKGFVTKKKEQGKLYISNMNNVKGLEFPFVICVETGSINTSILQRNSIYTALTRSFISSYFLVNSENDEFLRTYIRAANEIAQTGKMLLREPSEEEKAEQERKVKIAASSKRSLEDIVLDVCKDYSRLTNRQIESIINMVSIIEVDTEDEIREKTAETIKLLFGDK